MLTKAILLEVDSLLCGVLQTVNIIYVYEYTFV